MKALRPLRVLVLVQKGLVPPDEATAEELPGAPWKMEYGIIKTLRSLGHAQAVIVLAGRAREGGKQPGIEGVPPAGRAKPRP